MATDARPQAQLDLVDTMLLRLAGLLIAKGLVTPDDWLALTDAALAPLLKPEDPALVDIIGYAVPDDRQAAYVRDARAAHGRIRRAAAVLLGVPDPDDGG